MNVLGLDWETYYDNDYTLKKLSTTAYIRSPEFQAYGAAVRWNNERTAKWLLLPELKKYLKKVNWKQTALLAHHAHFDGLILTHHFKHKPAYYYDTLSMGRALYGVDTGVSLEKLSQYCGFGSKVEGYLEGVKGERKPSKAALDKLGRGAIRDCNLMWQLFRRMLEDFPEEELDLINYTIKCYTEPVFLVNKQKAQQLHNRVVRKRKALLKKVSGKARFTQKDYEELKTKLSSRTQYPEMLREAGVEPPMKVSPSWLKKPVAERDESKKYTFALAKTDLSFLALLEHPDEDVRNLVEAKLLCSSNIQETRPLRMIEHSDPALTIYLKYWGAKTTGRWSGADKMNPQNLSRDGELRQAILPPKGHKIVIGDSTAIEAVLNAYMAGQHDLLE